MPENMSERLPAPQGEVTPEKLPELRLVVASLREERGKDKEALGAIRWVREGAKRIGAHEDVVDLYWEEYLVGKHLVMEARDQKGSWKILPKAVDLGKGYLIMKHAALAADKYIDHHEVGGKKPRSGRFLGEIAMLEKRYPEAIGHFEKSVRLFSEMGNWRDRVNRLELSGFLAEALILAGRPEEGVGVARRTFLAYDKDDGAALKEADYYTWAVWKSGCVIKAWHALIAKGIPINNGLREGMVDMLEDAEAILVIPENKETWGDKDFKIRKREIFAIKHLTGLWSN